MGKKEQEKELSRISRELADVKKQLADARTEKKQDRRVTIASALIGLAGTIAAPIITYEFPPDSAPAHVQLTPAEAAQCPAEWNADLQFYDTHPDLAPIAIQGDPCNSIDVVKQHRHTVNIPIPPTAPVAPVAPSAPVAPAAPGPPPEHPPAG